MTSIRAAYLLSFSLSLLLFGAAARSTTGTFAADIDANGRFSVPVRPQAPVSGNSGIATALVDASPEAKEENKEALEEKKRSLPPVLRLTPQIGVKTQPKRVGRSGFFERRTPRAERSPDDRSKLAAELRAVYAKPSTAWPAPTVDEGVVWKELGVLPKVTFPESNPLSAAKVALGKTLFFDPRLSRTGEMACATCHDPDLGWADGRTVSFGLGRASLKRNSPSILNAGFATSFFWDGRAATLEEQATHVLLNKQEMDCSESVLKDRLATEPEYVQAFKDAFGDETISLDRVTQALATFERTLVGGRSEFDAFLKGKSDRLSDEAVLGLDLFRRDARCMNCHNGPLLSDGQFHDVGFSYYGRKYEDLGRYHVTKSAADVGRFRTPSLRSVTTTKPYMHNGLFELEAIMAMYNAGMPTLTPREHQKNDPLFPKKSPHLKPLGLNKQDLSDLIAFLESLKEPRLRVRPPHMPGTPPEATSRADVSPRTVSPAADAAGSTAP